MSIPRDYGKLRHLHPAGDWVALYARPVPPYYIVLPVVAWVLLTKDSTEKVVGFVGGHLPEAYPADDYPKGIFSRYVNLRLATPESNQAAINEVVAEGLAFEQQLLMTFDDETEGDDAPA